MTMLWATSTVVCDNCDLLTMKAEYDYNTHSVTWHCSNCQLTMYDTNLDTDKAEPKQCFCQECKEESKYRELFCSQCKVLTNETEMVFHKFRDYEPWCIDCHEKSNTER